MCVCMYIYILYGKHIYVYNIYIYNMYIFKDKKNKSKKSNLKARKQMDEWTINSSTLKAQK
jgi:hypothetical protein